MSSILKALRKIDEESPDLQSLPALPRMIDARRSVKARKQRRRLWVKVGAAVGMMAIMAGAGVFFLKPHQLIFLKPAGLSSPASTADAPQREMPIEPSNALQAKITTESVPTAPALHQTRQPEKKQASPSKPKENIQKPVKGPLEPQPETKIVQETPGTSAARMVSQAKTTDRKTPAPEIPKPAAAVSGSQQVKDKTFPSPPQPSTEYGRIDDSNLRLQALAWFDEPSKRMAVINDRIVREGESIDGYQITHIRQEDVVVTDGRQTWRLEFGLKQ